MLSLYNLLPCHLLDPIEVMRLMCYIQPTTVFSISYLAGEVAKYMECWHGWRHAGGLSNYIYLQRDIFSSQSR